MPNPFGNVKFSEYQPTYAGYPVEQFIKTASTLNERYNQTADMKDELDRALSSIKVDDVNNPHLANRINLVRENLRDLIAKGDYEHGFREVKQQFEDLANDKALRTSVEHYAARQATKENLRKKYETGYFDKELYDDEVAKFNNYQGIGTPDELGFYNDYSHEEGAKYVDLTKLTDEVLSNYQGRDTTSSASITNEYEDKAGFKADELRRYGSPTSTKRVTTSTVSGIEAAGMITDQIRNNPDAMAYVNRVVSIRNAKNPDAPITADDVIGEFAEYGRKKVDKKDIDVIEQEQALDIAAVYNRRRSERPENPTPFNLVAPKPATPVVDKDRDTGDMLGGGFKRFMQNFGNSMLGVVQNPFVPVNAIVNWQNKDLHYQEEVNKLPANDQNRLKNLIYLHGSKTDKRALQNAGGDVTKMSGNDIAKATTNIDKNIKKAPNERVSYFVKTPVGAAKQLVDQTFPEGSTLGDNTYFDTAPIYVYSNGQNKEQFYNSGAEFLADNPTLKDRKIQSVTMSTIDDDGYLLTGEPRMSQSMVLSAGGLTIAVGASDMIPDSRYLQMTSAYSRLYNEIRAEIPKGELDVSKPITSIPNLFAENRDDTDKYEVYASKNKVGGKTIYMYQIRNPKTGNVSMTSDGRPHTTFEGALGDIAARDAETSNYVIGEVDGQPVYKYTDFGYIVGQEEYTISNSQKDNNINR